MLLDLLGRQLVRDQVSRLFKAPPGKTRDAAYACVIRSSRAAFRSKPITFAPKHGILGVDNNLDRVYYVY